MPPFLFLAAGKLPAQVLEQAARSLFRQVQNPLEALGAAVIGIWHLAQGRVTGKLQKELQLVRVRRRAQPLEQSQVRFVHGQDIVEFVEVVPGDLPPAQSGQIVAPLYRGALRAGIGGLVYVIVVRSGRIAEDMFLQPCLCDKMPENTFRCRRTTDISHANEENPDLPHLQAASRNSRFLSAFN